MSEKYHRAARDGFLDILRDGNRKEMNTPDEDGCTPMMLAAQFGNLDALRMIIMRGGDVNKIDLLGFTALHHSAQKGHMNCVTFLVNFGANFWMMDNDYNTAFDIAALENREDIMKYLDDTQSIQERKNPKMVQKFKVKANTEAEKNAKLYERLQVKASKDMEKTRRFDGKEPIDNADFKPPSKQSFVKNLTQRIKGNSSTLKALKTSNGASSAFSELAHGTARKKAQKKTQDTEFHVSVMDERGNRTVRSVGGKGTMVRNNAEVLYLANNKEIVDNSARPALTNVFKGTSLDNKNWNKSKSDSNLLDDSGVDSFESEYNDDEEMPGIFNRPNFGLTFLTRFDHMSSSQNNTSADDIDKDVNGDLALNDDREAHNRASGYSTGTSGSLNDETHDVPWKDEDVEPLDDDEDETEYTPVVMFLEGCGLTHYTHLFTNEDVDMETLMLLTNQDFQDMGLPIGPRTKLMDAIQRRRVVLNEPAQMYDTQL